MRDTFIIFFGIIIALVVGAYFYFGHSDNAAPQAAPESSYVILKEGTNAGRIDTRTNYRIESDDELSGLWTLIYGTNTPPLPTVDFTKYEIIGVFDGSHSTGGYGIEVSQVRDADGKRTVHIRHTVPSDRCVPPQTITSPFQIVRVPKTTLPISREDETVTVSC